MAELQELDLLGHPMKPLRDPRGRPSFAKTKENQLLIMSLRAKGLTQADVAIYMNANEKTLRKHFSRELTHGALILEGLAMQVIVQKMLAGNLSAARQVLEITQARIPTKPAARPEPQLGKKELAARDAHDVPGEWGDLVPDGRLN